VARLILIPIVAKSLFIKDFALIEGKDWIEHYYREQCAMKFLYGKDATIKFI
jgi:hypothetical protein